MRLVGGVNPDKAPSPQCSYYFAAGSTYYTATADAENAQAFVIEIKR